MVICIKCGEENNENAKYCSSCGANLGKIEKRGKSSRDDCFGLPNSGAIAGIVFGILIILWGLSITFEWKINVMAVMVILLGTLIVAGAIYKLTKRRR